MQLVTESTIDYMRKAIVRNNHDDIEYGINLSRRGHLGVNALIR